MRPLADLCKAGILDLPRLVDAGSVRCVITSPPYLDVTNFEEDQWLRLWFQGGPPKPTWGAFRLMTAMRIMIGIGGS